MTIVIASHNPHAFEQQLRGEWAFPPSLRILYPGAVCPVFVLSTLLPVCFQEIYDERSYKESWAPINRAMAEHSTVSDLFIY